LPAWFWYDERDPDYSDYLALNSTYTAAYSWLGPKRDFPQHGCDRTVEPGELIVVTSRNKQVAEVAQTILAGCWRAFGMKPVVEEVDVLQRSDESYTVAMLKATTDSSILRSLRAVFDSTGKAVLQPVENPTETVSLLWTAGPS